MGQIKVVLGALLLFLSGQAHSATLYTDRTLFENSLAVTITDDYNKTRYPVPTYTDEEMSAALGETNYQSTGWNHQVLVWGTGSATGESFYCAGCNGSFLLDFTETSVGNISGVFGVGFEVFGPAYVFGTTAFVTFGDGSTANYEIPETDGWGAEEFPFWGITDNLLISNIHFGLVDGGTNTDESVQRMALDNLTIGSASTIPPVPVPAAVWLFGTALVGFIGVSRRRKVA